MIIIFLFSISSNCMQRQGDKTVPIPIPETLKKALAKYQ